MLISEPTKHDAGITIYRDYLDLNSLPKTIHFLVDGITFGIPIGLETGTISERTLRRLNRAGIKDYFRVIVAGDEVPRGKPSPDVYLDAARQLSLSPQDCLVFEDSYAGIQAATAAGMRAVMVPDLELPTRGAKQMAYCILPSLTDAIERLPEFMGKSTANTAVEWDASLQSGSRPSP